MSFVQFVSIFAMQERIISFLSVYQFKMCMKQCAKPLLVFYVIIAGLFISCNPPKRAEAPVNQQVGTVTRAQHNPNPHPIIPQRDFLFQWLGSENCNDGKAETPVTITLTAKDSTGVYVSGFYGTTDKIEGVIRGYVVVISRQQINLLPKGSTIEGTLILSNDRETLRGFYTKQINGQIDSCKAVYRPNKF